MVGRWSNHRPNRNVHSAPVTRVNSPSFTPDTKTLTDPECVYRNATSDIWGELFNSGYFTLVNKPVVIDTTEPQYEVLTPEEAARRIVKAIGASMNDEDEAFDDEE